MSSTAPHGTASTYNNHKCRCDECRIAWAEYVKARRVTPRTVKRWMESQNASLAVSTERDDPSAEIRRARDREYHRRRRSKFYEAGLSNLGAPLQRPDLAEKRRTVGPVDHPAGCLCYGCLYPPEPYQPKVCRSGAMK